MKYHPNLLHAVVSILKENFSSSLNADKIIQHLLRKNKKWGSRDRKFVAETSYNIIRKWRLLWELSGEIPSLSDEKLFSIIAIELFISTREDELLKLKTKFSSAEIDERLKKNEAHRAIRESIPDWLDKLGEDALGNRWDEEISALNQQAKVVLRVNELKISRDELAQKLNDENIETEKVEDVPSALVLSNRQNIFTNKFFKDGFFEVQDASSQKVAMQMKLEPGLRIVDACAGGGGKSLQIATLMKNRGKVLALDTNEKKINQLRERSRRNSISIIETKVIDSTKVFKRLYDSADRLLLDVPCSGLGVLRRNPDAKWKLSIEKIQELIELQKNILNTYCNITKVNGYLIYSTCSLLPSENENQIENFLQHHSNFSLEEAVSISPARSGFDGFFIARLKRKN